MYVHKKLSRNDYEGMLKHINDTIAREEAEKKAHAAAERQLLKEQGKTPRGAAPKPIISQRFTEIVKQNYFRGNVDDVHFCQLMNIRPEKMDVVLYS